MQPDMKHIDVAAFGATVRAELCFQNEFYARHILRLPDSRARGHIFQISRSSPLSLLVSVDQQALSLDFSRYSTRPGVPGR
jgi:hypothetical protein